MSEGKIPHSLHDNKFLVLQSSDVFSELSLERMRTNSHPYRAAGLQHLHVLNK